MNVVLISTGQFERQDGDQGLRPMRDQCCGGRRRQPGGRERYGSRRRCRLHDPPCQFVRFHAQFTIELFPERLKMPEGETAVVHGEMRPDDGLVRRFAKRIDGQQPAGNFQTSPVITLALKNPQQPRSRLAPLIVEAAAVVLKPF